MPLPRLIQRTRDVLAAGTRAYLHGGFRASREFLSRTRGNAVAPVLPHSAHIERAVQWLCRAQDQSGCDGVSWGYDLLRGWRAAYPETTGYLIPTIFDAAQHLDRMELAERAIRMAHWECDVQLPDGSVMAGTIDSATKSAALFNTGQVLLGWTRAYRETGEARFAEAAVRAGEWMLGCQDAAGAWYKGLSPKAGLAGPRSYNVRSAWGLLNAGQALNRDDFVQAASRNADWTLTQQRDNGWIDNCCLSDAGRPLTHTLAYACRGLLEIGQALNEQRFIDASLAAALPLAAAVDDRGFLAGRYDRSWRPTVKWSCLTGQCQMAIVWLKLGKLSGNRQLVSAAQRSLEYVKGRQSANQADPDVFGAVPGSSPITGEYARLRFPNWPAKFFVDALLLDRQIDSVTSREPMADQLALVPTTNQLGGINK